MAKRRAKKSKASSKSRAAPKSRASSARKAAPAKAAAPAGAPHLHKVIEELIAAKQRGDQAAGDKAASALEALRKHGAASVRQAAAEARAVAANPVMTESTRMLGNLAARLKLET
jgi:hypothetical protein